jgi:hypothetical protein
MFRLRIDLPIDDALPQEQQARHIASALRRYANGVESLGCVPSGPIPLVGYDGLSSGGRAWVDSETVTLSREIRRDFPAIG